MKKILYIILGTLGFITLSCNEDYLNVTSQSSVDQDFVFATPEGAFKALADCYHLWITDGAGKGELSQLYYYLDAVGSDSECHPEAYTDERYAFEVLSPHLASIDWEKSKLGWAVLYKIANRASIIMETIADKAEYQNAVNSGKVNDWTQLYGEACIFRAYAYFYLIRYFGDVPHFEKAIYSTSQTENVILTSRYEIYDKELDMLKKVEPLMYRLGEGGITAERFSRSFAQGLIGKMALFAGGYSICRTDGQGVDYGNVSLETKGAENWNSRYVRRTDYKKYYETARDYLKKLVDEGGSGSAHLITSDERGADFNNPFQRNFQYNMDLEVSPESLFELGYKQDYENSEWGYAFGRPANRGGIYPQNAYGQSRFHASFYYGDYDNDDMRRDVTITVSCNGGSCNEVLLKLLPGNRNQGGLANNKWDQSRMANPFNRLERKSGINWCHMRMADAILMLAEAYAELGEEGSAKSELKTVRSRAFSIDKQAEKVEKYINSLSGDALKEAIQQERKLELAGEGVRRYDLIRIGKFPEAIKKIRDTQIEMVNGLESNGYYTFANGNTISGNVWVKMVNTADYGLKYMLTAQCEVNEEDSKYPVLFPGWRGNSDKWNNGFSNAEGKRNMAVRGLFRYIDPNGPEAAALEADGYVKTAWGSDIVRSKVEFTTNIFKGYTDADYAAGNPPRYLLPMSSQTIAQSFGLLTNGYGLGQE